MWRIGWAPNNASKWQVGFNSALKELKVKCFRKLSRAANTACRVLHISGVQRPDQHSQTSQMSMTVALQKNCWTLRRQNEPKQWNFPAESVTSSYQPTSVTVESVVVVPWDIRNAVLCYRASEMSGYTSQFIWEIRSSNASHDKGALFLNPYPANVKNMVSS